MDTEKYRVYAVAIPDTEEAFLALTSDVTSWNELTTNPLNATEADSLVETAFGTVER